jgi:hypothetical protein
MSFTFAKHETFYVRDGWLNKGMSAIQENPNIFLDEDAPEKLGLGKNMVRALRFWMQATGVAEEQIIDRRTAQVLTPFGELLAEFDPYQELDGTTWFIHHHLISNSQLTTTWYWFFNHYVPTKFTYREFMARLKAWLNTQVDEHTKKVAEGSLRKDFDCLVKTYLPSQRDTSPEDVLESPLTVLGLLASASERDEETGRQIKTYRLNLGEPDTIHPLVMLYVMLKAQHINERDEARQVALQVALREANNVGRTFNIRPTDFEDVLSSLNDRYPEYRVALVRTGGLDQLTLPSVSPEDVMKNYYQEQSDTAEGMPQVWSRPLKA